MHRVVAVVEGDRAPGRPVALARRRGSAGSRVASIGHRLLGDARRSRPRARPRCSRRGCASTVVTSDRVDPLLVEHRARTSLGRVGRHRRVRRARRASRLCASIRAGLMSASATSSAVSAWSVTRARTNISARAPVPTSGVRARRASPRPLGPAKVCSELTMPVRRRQQSASSMSDLSVRKGLALRRS